MNQVIQTIDYRRTQENSTEVDPKFAFFVIRIFGKVWYVLYSDLTRFVLSFIFFFNH